MRLKIYKIAVVVYLSFLSALSVGGQSLDAFFEYSIIDQQSSTVRFYNLSQGDIAGATWTFGDGNYLTGTADSVTHTFAEMDFYQVCLTIWDAAGSVDEHCIEFFTGPDNLMCNYTDCVYPGDANGDGKANLYDMLHIGLGLGVKGVPRPNASLEWIGQPAPDWGVLSNADVDLKHLDCDGNGWIESADIEGVFFNNQSLPKQLQIADNEGPEIFLKFQKDSIFLQDYAGQDTIHLIADVYLGTEADGFTNLHGLSCYIDYEEGLFEDYSPSIEYDNTSFTGAMWDQVLVGWKDQPGVSQIDFAVTRTSGGGASGGGKVGQARFIIVSDIIEARTIKDELDLEFPLRGVKAFDDQGNPVFTNVTKFPATVTFFMGTVTGVSSSNPDISLQVFPNPATDVVRIIPGDVQIESIELLSAVGNQLYVAKSVNNRQPVLSLSHLPSGVYLLRIATNRGIVVRQIVRH